MKKLSLAQVLSYACHGVLIFSFLCLASSQVQQQALVPPPPPLAPAPAPAPEVPQPQSTTDPNEVSALSNIFRKWGISINWNTSGDPCSGAATDSDTAYFVNNNVAIRCDCSYNHGSTCHITQFKAYDTSINGVIPEELWSLGYLFDLNLGQNHLTGSIPKSIGNLNRMQYLSFQRNALSGELPKEFGKHTDLISLSVGENNFSGPLPTEFGSLTKLEQLD